jgi:hypothetical protein
MNLRRGWESPLKPPVCPACGAVNHRMAPMCTKCSHALPPAEELGGDAVAGAAPGPESKEIAKTTDLHGTVLPPYLKNDSPRKTLGAAPPAALVAASQPMPVSGMDEQQIVTGMEPSWPLWTWGLVLVLFVGAAAAVLIDSLFLTTSEPAIKSRGEEMASGLVPTRSIAQVFADNNEEVLPVESKSEAKASTPISNFPVTSARLQKNHQTPRVVQQSKSATVHEAGTAAAAGKKTAQATGARRQRLVSQTPTPIQKEFIPRAGTQCSAAVKALALCSAQAD